MKLLATTLTVLAASTSLHAVKLAGDEFQRVTVSGNVNGSVGPAGSDFGWGATSWSANTTAPAVTFVAGTTAALSYTATGINVPASGTLGGANSAVQIVSGNNITDSNVLSRQFQTAISAASTQNVYVSFIMRYTVGTFTDASDVFYLWVGNSATPASATHLEAGFRANATNDIAVRAPTGTQGTLTNGTGVDLAASTTANLFVIAKFTADLNTNYNRVQFFVNPTGIIPDNAGTGSTTTANTAGNVGPATLTHLGFGIGALDTSETFQIDNLQVGTTWQDVITPVPFGVDSTTGLALLGVASAWKLRRRRSKV